jgi:hypothetical protein
VHPSDLGRVVYRELRTINEPWYGVQYGDVTLPWGRATNARVRDIRRLAKERPDFEWVLLDLPKV